MSGGCRESSETEGRLYVVSRVCQVVRLRVALVFRWSQKIW